VIDGKVDDAAWQSAPVAADFVTAIGNKANAQTKAMIGYDAENLYVAMVATEPDVKSLGAKAQKGTKIWSARDDAVALFLKPADSDVYYQFAVNPRGVGYNKEHHGRGIKWAGSNLAVKPHIGDGYWSVEYKIPFKDLKDIKPQAGSTWDVNFCRIRPRSGEASSWAQISQWNRVTDAGYWEGLNIGVPDSDRIAIVKVAWPDQVKFGENPLSLAFENKRERGDIWVVTQVDAPGGATQQTKKKVTVEAKRECEMDTSFLIALAAGTHAVKVTFSDSETTATPFYQLPPKTYEIEPFMRAVLDRNYYTTEEQAKVLIDIDLAEEAARGIGVHCLLSGAGEKSVAQVKIPTTKISLPIDGLKPAEHAGTVQLLQNGKAIGNPVSLILRKLPPAKHEVKIDRERLCMLVDGEPFFALGVCNHGIPRDLTTLDRMSGSGLNYVMCSWHGLEGFREYGRRKQADREQKILAKMTALLDRAHANGMKHVSYITSFYKYMGTSKKSQRETSNNVNAWCRDPSSPLPPDVKAARERVSYWVDKLKDHPALLAYHHFDEIGESQIPEGDAVSAILRRVDPYHAIEVVCESRHPEKFGPMSDILNADPSWVPGPGVGLSTQLKVDTYSRGARKCRVPLWLVPLCRTKRNARREIGPELRPNAYQCVIGGATGIMWYPGFGPVHKRGAAEFLKVIKEFRTLGPVLIEETPLQRIEQDAESRRYFRVLLKEHKDNLYLLCVNLIENGQDVDIKIPQMPKDAQVTRLFKGGTIQAQDRGFRDTIASLDTRVYRLKPESPAPYTVSISTKKNDERIDFKKWYTSEQGAFFHPYYRTISISGTGNTLASITKDIGNPDIISYDPKARTCAIRRGLHLCYAGDLTIGDENDPDKGEKVVFPEAEQGGGKPGIRVWGRLKIFSSQFRGISTISTRHNTGHVTVRDSRFTNCGWIGVLACGGANGDASSFDVRNCEFDNCSRHVVAANLSPFVGWDIHDNEKGMFWPALIKYTKSKIFTFVDCQMTRNAVEAKQYACRDLVYVNTRDEAVANKGFQPTSLLVKWHANFEVLDQNNRPLPGALIALESGCPEYNDSRTTDKDGRCTIDAVQFFRQGDADIKPVYEIRAVVKDKTFVLAPEWQCNGNVRFKYQLEKELGVVKEEKSPYAAKPKQVLKKKRQ